MLALFVSFTVKFIVTGLRGFPMDPPWLVVFWGNCILSGAMYGLLGIWLATHGNMISMMTYAKTRTMVG